MLTRRQKHAEVAASSSVQANGVWGALPTDVLLQILDAVVALLAALRQQADPFALKDFATMQQATAQSKHLASLLLVSRTWKEQVESHPAFLRYRRLETLALASYHQDWVNFVLTGQGRDFKRRKMPTVLQYAVPLDTPLNTDVETQRASSSGSGGGRVVMVQRHQLLVLRQRSASDRIYCPANALLLRLDLTCPLHPASSSRTGLEAGPGPVGAQSVMMSVSSCKQPSHGARNAASAPPENGSAAPAAAGPAGQCDMHAWDAGLRLLRPVLKTLCKDLVTLDTSYAAGMVVKVMVSFTSTAAAPTAEADGLVAAARSGKGRQVVGPDSTQMPHLPQLRGALHQLAADLTTKAVHVELHTEGNGVWLEYHGSHLTAVVFVTPTVASFTRRRGTVAL